MITVSWSLSYEMFYYLLIPLIVSSLGLRDRSAKWRVSFFITITLAVVGYSALYGGHIRLIMFVAGILLYETMDKPRVATPPNYVGVMGLVLGLLSTLIPIAGNSGQALRICLLFVCFFSVCLAYFKNPISWAASFFLWTPVRWLGNMSYSYYLVHGLALKAMFLVLLKVVPGTDYGAWSFCLLMPIMFGLSIIPAAILFLSVERPFSVATRKP